jgi:hypothetical protein
MKTFFKMALVIASLSPFAIKADIASDLKDMISSAGERAGATIAFTSPASVNNGKLKGLNRTALDFGGLRIRTPIKNFNIVAFSPPNISAGCSGVDLTLGSFSFLSRDELIAMLRSIASNALMYGFGQAISAMCKDCWTGITTLQSKVQELNQMFRNTCTVGKCLNDENCVDQMVTDTTCLFSSGWTAEYDYAACQEKSKEDDKKGEIAASIKNNATGDEQLPFLYGNQTWEMLGEINVGDVEATVQPLRNIMALTMTGKDLLLNFLGTVVMKGKETVPYKAALSFDTLFYPGVAEADSILAKVISCAATPAETHAGKDYECMKPKRINFDPTTTNIQEIIAASLNRINIAVGGSIATNSAGLETLDVYLMNFIPPPINRAISSANLADKTAALIIIKSLKDVITTRIVYDFSKGIYSLTSDYTAAANETGLLSVTAKDIKVILKQMETSVKSYRIAHDKAQVEINKNPSYSMLLQKYSNDDIETLSNMTGN